MRATARLRLAVLTAGAMLAIGVPAQASAAPAIEWSACTGHAGWECGTLTVPLDRSGAVPGTVTLSVSRAVATDNPTRSAVLALAGGPGQAALPLRETLAEVTAAALAHRDLLVFDQRGTGSSGPLDCPSLNSARSFSTAIGGCASSLGPARGLYRTVDSVDDIEALRQAAGYDSLVLFGVSYGTKVAETYASLHPDRTEALLLDSVVLPDGPDPFRRSSLRAVPRVLSDLCANRACRRATPNVNADLRTLIAKLRRGTISGPVIDAAGRQVTARLDLDDLVQVLLAGDFNPALRAELPGAMRAALRGDPAPLLRLASRGGTPAAGLAADSDHADFALFLATSCEEAPLPWSRTAGLSARINATAVAIARLSAADTAPFPAATALRAGTIPFCLPWPDASPAPQPLPPLPRVPTLVLSGEMDVRTPLEDARTIGRLIPGARIAEIAWAGHSVLTSDRSRCAAAAVREFFEQAAQTPCALSGNPYAPTPRPPRSLAEVSTPRRGGRTGRIAAAVGATLTDARRQVVGEALAEGRVPRSVGGLRAGTVRPRAAAGELTMRLIGYQYVPGLAVSGSYTTGRGGTVTVRGRGIAGRLRISAKGGLSGRINGRPVSVARAAWALPQRLPSGPLSPFS